MIPAPEQPDQLVAERPAAGDVLPDELGDLVAVAPEPTLRSLQRPARRLTISVEECSGSTSACAARAFSASRFGDDDDAPVGVSGVDHPLPQSVQGPSGHQASGRR